MDFVEWLENTKFLQHRSAQDVRSHLRRVKKILGAETIDENTSAILERNDAYLALPRGIQRQLRRAIRLFLEFKSEKSALSK